jgi:hypothetical protein
MGAITQRWLHAIGVPLRLAAVLVSELREFASGSGDWKPEKDWS